MVKYSLLFFTTFLLVSCGSSKKVVVAEKTQLQYDLILANESLRLQIDVSTTEPHSFQYSIPAQSITGSIIMTKDAEKSSSELYHTFAGQDIKLTKSTSIWLSDSVFESLAEGKATTISYRQGFVKNELEYQVKEKQKILYNINGKPTSLEVLYIEDLHKKGFKIWVLNNPENPLIMRLNFGWQLILKDIVNDAA